MGSLQINEAIFQFLVHMFRDSENAQVLQAIVLIFIKIYSHLSLDKRQNYTEVLKQFFPQMVHYSKMLYEMQNLLNPFRQTVRDYMREEPNFQRLKHKKSEANVDMQIETNPYIIEATMTNLLINDYSKILEATEENYNQINIQLTPNTSLKAVELAQSQIFPFVKHFNCALFDFVVFRNKILKLDARS